MLIRWESSDTARVSSLTEKDFEVLRTNTFEEAVASHCCLLVNECRCAYVLSSISSYCVALSRTSNIFMVPLLHGTYIYLFSLYFYIIPKFTHLLHLYVYFYINLHTYFLILIHVGCFICQSLTFIRCLCAQLHICICALVCMLVRDSKLRTKVKLLVGFVLLVGINFDECSINFLCTSNLMFQDAAFPNLEVWDRQTDRCANVHIACA